MLRPQDKDNTTHLLDNEGMLQELSEADREKLANVKERIKKLLAKGKDDRNISAQEMESAMNMAVSLARKNGLDLYAIEREANKNGSAFITRILELGGHANWRVQLVHVIARALICRIVTYTTTQMSTKANARTGNVIRRPRADYVSVIGMPSDIELLDYLYEYIVRELEREANAIYKEDKATMALVGRKISGKAFRDDFYRGAIRALDSRLVKLFTPEPVGGSASSVTMSELDADAAAEDGELDYQDRPGDPSMALVPLKEADVKAAMEEMFPNLGKGGDIWSKNSTTITVVRHNAYMAGHRAGEKLELRKALNANVTGAIGGAQ